MSRLAKLALAAALALLPLAGRAETPTEVRVAYSAIEPETLIVKSKGWLESDLAARGFKVKWIESLGSNKTIEFLRGNSIDIGSTSLASAFLARANGTPLKYVFWTGRVPTGSPILVRNDSPYKNFIDLKGKKIAATPGTGPYISLIAALKANGLTQKDVQIVALQHPQGRQALATGAVDGWAGLDPDWAIAELQNNAHVLWADPKLAGGGGIDVRDDFLAAHRDVVLVVLNAFDRARQFAKDHPEDAIQLFADAAHLEEPVAKIVYARAGEDRPALEPRDSTDLANWGNLYKDLGAIPAETDVNAVVKSVLDFTVFPAKPAS